MCTSLTDRKLQENNDNIKQLNIYLHLCLFLWSATNELEVDEEYRKIKIGSICYHLESGKHNFSKFLVVVPSVFIRRSFSP